MEGVFADLRVLNPKIALARIRLAKSFKEAIVPTKR
jgi:hypothetical protein